MAEPMLSGMSIFSSLSLILYIVSWKEEVWTFTVSFLTKTIHRETEEKALNLEWKYRTCRSILNHNTFFCNV